MHHRTKQVGFLLYDTCNVVGDVMWWRIFKVLFVFLPYSLLIKQVRGFNFIFDFHRNEIILYALLLLPFVIMSVKVMQWMLWQFVLSRCYAVSYCVNATIYLSIAQLWTFGLFPVFALMNKVAVNILWLLTRI